MANQNEADRMVDQYLRDSKDGLYDMVRGKLRECPCRKDDNGCVIVPDLSCEQHKDLRHRLAGGEGL